METEKNYQEPQECPQQEAATEDELTKSQSTDMEEPTATTEEDKVTDPVEALTAQLAALNDSHLRLMAEYDNYRKRTLKEKSDLIRNGGEKVLTELLPVIDD
ncbi:nucleotide exchange factor GrpE, partial [Porphyromonas loveana]|uniref:nucleotide exchange factor GrpE n=1 Tax=Porphyromonas loveana TaxID=1884669 RepID=UPI0035A013E9